MKSTCALATFYIIVSTICSQKGQAQRTSLFTVQIEEARLVRKNSVGNEWSHSVTLIVDEKEYSIKRSPSEILINHKSKISLEVDVMEDDKYPDFGHTSHSIKSADLFVRSLSKDVLTVNVTENRGRFSGNTAQWRFVVIFQH